MSLQPALFALAVLTSEAIGQTPEPAASSGGAFLTGVVRDVGGSPLAGVSVTLIGEAAAARTDSAGQFALRDLIAGGHTALFRRLGYHSVEYRWVAQPGRGLQVAVTMTPVPRQLERIVVEAPGGSRRRGTSSVSGTVLDSAGDAVVGADVRLLGAGLSTVTDSTGQFSFQMLAAGSYIVRARRKGVTSTNYVMQLVDDDARGITLKLFDLPKKTNSRDVETASGYGSADVGLAAFDRRQRSSPAQPVLGPGDLFRANHAPLDLVLQQYRDLGLKRRPSSLVHEGAGSSDDGDCLLIDGRRAAYQPLRSFSSLDVQMVEVFRANAFVDEYIVSRMDAFKECQGSEDHHPSYFVLWTRSLR